MNGSASPVDKGVWSIYEVDASSSVEQLEQNEKTTKGNDEETKGEEKDWNDLERLEASSIINSPRKYCTTIKWADPIIKKKKKIFFFFVSHV